MGGRRSDCPALCFKAWGCPKRISGVLGATPRPLGCGLRYPCIYAAAGPGMSGNLIELLLTEQEDGTFVACHAMKLTKKTDRELNL